MSAALQSASARRWASVQRSHLRHIARYTVADEAR